MVIDNYFRFNIGDKVAYNDIKGVVIGLYVYRDGDKQVLIEYMISTGALMQMWQGEDYIELI